MDREIVLYAIEQDKEALFYTDDSLKKDEKFLIEAIKKNTSIKDYCSYQHYIKSENIKSYLLWYLIKDASNI